MALDPQEGLNASRQASARRAAMLLRLSRLADTDGRQCLPTLIKACQCDTAMLAMRVWRVDQAVFGMGASRRAHCSRGPDRRPIVRCQ